mmetsp:Transcript_61121/g.182120  ORF Transcript_61121/g.182120 Transcript_61121/m.182120 type:complete len:220 (-) Transcript_61121:456-1115(-)
MPTCGSENYNGSRGCVHFDSRRKKHLKGPSYVQGICKRAAILRYRAQLGTRRSADVAAAICRLGHLEHQQHGAVTSRRPLQRLRPCELGCVVAPQGDLAARERGLALDAEQVRLPAARQLQRPGGGARAELRHVDVAVLADLHGRFDAAVHVRDQVCPPVPASSTCCSVTHHGSVVRSQPPLSGHHPGLYEAEGLLAVPVVLGVAHTRACRHELDAASP